jgi:phosphatidylserine decarboxylase
MRLPLTRYAIPEIAIFALVFGGGSVAGWFVHPALAIVPAALLVFSLSFFRDPSRPIPGDAATIVSPADGRVADIVEVEDAPFVGGRSWRVGIFLSVFDVHVNRVPLAGTVVHHVRRSGGFLDARDPQCIEANQAVEIGLEAPRAGEEPVRLLVRQITGLIARRIVCPVAVGDSFGRGERYGMIKFGSRTEIYVRDGDLQEMRVKVGDRVKGGSSVIGRIRTRDARQEAAA